MNDSMKSTSSSEESYEDRGANGADNSDRPTRLCDLPNEILHSILVLLPIEEAIRTCVLARRWQHIWRSMPRLIIINRDCKVPSYHFVNFVHKVCTLHDPYYPIQKFELRCHLDRYQAPLIDISITTAIKSRVQEFSLYLNTCYSEPYVLPHCILSSETLVQLHLSGDCRKLKLSGYVSLQRLKVLNLRMLEFGDVKSIQELFSSPLLEELTVYHCCWRDTRSVVTIYARNLRRLEIVSNISHNLPPLWMHCESLKELEYYGPLEHEFHVYGESMKLDHAILSLGVKTVADRGIKLLSCLSSTKKLSLRSQTSVALGSTSQLLGLPRFDNLIELSFLGFYTPEVTALKILRKSPSLRILILQGFWVRIPLQTSDLLDPVPLFHLKKIVIAPTGNIDVDLMGMLLKTRVVLEEVVLKILRSSVDEELLLEVLRNLPKASEDCKISLRYI